MNILEKIDFLMKRNGIKNRAELSELSGIPYSTINGIQGFYITNPPDFIYILPYFHQ